MTRRDFLGFGALAAAGSLTGGCRSLFGGNGAVDPNLAVFISDVHVRDGSYSLERFARVVDGILAMSPRPRNVVCFGDIAHLRGPVEDYRASRPQFQRLADAGITLTFGMGNHDRRKAFLDVWPEYRNRLLMDDFIVSDVNLGSCDLLMLDTLHEPDNPEAEKRGWITDGQFKERRLAWLKAEVARRKRPFFLGAHHPIQEITDGNWKAISDLIMATPACLGWIHGHDHVWKNGLIAPSKRNWADNNFKRWLCLPSTGYWGDIGYAAVRTSPGLLRADLVMLDRFFPNPDKRTWIDGEIVREKQNLFWSVRFQA